MLCVQMPAPEIQLSKCCSIRSDMFSLGMVIAAIYNDGRSLIQANHSNSDYIKQLDSVSSFLFVDYFFFL